MERTLSSGGIIRKFNLLLSFFLIFFGMVINVTIGQKMILGVAGLLSFLAAITSKDNVNYAINILLGLMFIFSAFFV